MLIGYDKTKGVRNNRYFIFDLSRQQWLPELRGSYMPKGGSNKQHCATFKTGGKTKVFLSGYAYQTNLYDVSSKKWEAGEFVIPKILAWKNSKTVMLWPSAEWKAATANNQGCIRLCIVHFFQSLCEDQQPNCDLSNVLLHLFNSICLGLLLVSKILILQIVFHSICQLSGCCASNIRIMQRETYFKI